MGYRVAIVGATGNVGREMLAILEELEFPVDEIFAVASACSLARIRRCVRHGRARWRHYGTREPWHPRSARGRLERNNDAHPHRLVSPDLLRGPHRLHGRAQGT